MAEFKSQYAELGFYVDKVFYKFNDGRFVTEDAAVIEALSKITDAERVDEPKAEEKPAAKPKAPARKPSAK